MYGNISRRSASQADIPKIYEMIKKLQGDNKRLLIVPGANHTDLYDKMEIIPFDEIAAFYREYLK